MRRDAIWEKLLRASKRRAAYALLLVPISAVTVRATTGAKDAPPRSADEAERKSMFSMIASNEPTYRREVVKDFPTDPWSQDDAFHEREFQRIRSVTSGRGVRLVDGLLGLDDGLRASRPGRYRATVPPCRPRTIY